ncbi:oxygen-independent coproporphyrinogen III oxidase (plasmid) [Legionella adelaidensis]|uniref:Heme chaperone HemW n=1 Tax=Legionella adelaidensis TaxID=45056 RepID=A0A0W0R2R0_9GAMM|nr:radical SAM family heme chaperone HemW [Legionella adelaidensis]KTC65366.1 oxygen-independent coproporphyrinogen III oxidase [Legionella adelaidensis]VEH84812.1 oxygen-independent coproporphyrinogen III oxidase [Legionella adelaidensis]
MIPLSLYIHIPWCIQKCPYCDFNSHKSPSQLPEMEYVAALVADLRHDLEHFTLNKPTINTIFIGGGTPSLLSGEAYHQLFLELNKIVTIPAGTEITLEANPGTVEQKRFQNYRELGINRLSLGIQSFHAKHLKALGRIHDDTQAHKAIESARKAGFTNINLDIMHSLPHQTQAEGIADLRTAIRHQPEHISWYQLTLEPNTVFYKTAPPLPEEELTFHLEEEGFSLLKEHDYTRYEISAFCKPQKHASHNLNYWQFGDYLGIGAGAHGKITKDRKVYRTQKHRIPRDYLSKDKPFLTHCEKIDKENLLFEFMLNTTRLENPIANELFTATTGGDFSELFSKLNQAKVKGLIDCRETHWQVTKLGRKFTNDLQALFLPD